MIALLSVVIPAKNEQENIEPLVEEIVASLAPVCPFEIVYVDDGSTDNTYRVLRELAMARFPQVRVVKHQYSVGQSTAVHTGVTHAKGELIVTLDADGQNDPADIPALLEAAKSFTPGQCFCIGGYRKNRKDTAWKRFQSRIANRIRSRFLNDDTPDSGCGIKLFPRETFLKLPYFDHMHRFIPALVKRSGGEIRVVPVNHRDRRHGTSNYTMLSRLWVGIVDMFGVLWLQKRAKIAHVVFDDE